MSSTTNKMIEPLEKDERLILDTKSSIFSNRALCSKNPSVSRSFEKDLLLKKPSEHREPFSKPRMSLEMDRDEKGNPKRRFERRNSKTAEMMLAGVLSSSRQQHQHSSTTLFPMTKLASVVEEQNVMGESSSSALHATNGPPYSPVDFDEESLRLRLRTSLGLYSVEGKVVHGRSACQDEDYDKLEPDRKRRKHVGNQEGNVSN